MGSSSMLHKWRTRDGYESFSSIVWKCRSRNVKQVKRKILPKEHATVFTCSLILNLRTICPLFEFYPTKFRTTAGRPTPARKFNLHVIWRIGQTQFQLSAMIRDVQKFLPVMVCFFDWSILTNFVNTRALLTQARYATWQRSETFQRVTRCSNLW